MDVNSIARYTFAEGVQNIANAISLGMTRSKITAVSVLNIVVEDHPGSKYKTLDDRFVNILQKLTLSRKMSEL
ncbi:hypothetical protein CEXT_38571 [Caerostris extrusa]|uniref:Uncharacterized protein n=1 Tax=Caerostris extrusa TaxID=172846 RepID=A0AAV4VUP6_CAEEX|nr:hypothetical protein CEXT_38571 [Caerostris extrusa]